MWAGGGGGGFDGVMMYLNSEIAEKSHIHAILLECFFFYVKKSTLEEICIFLLKTVFLTPKN